MKWFLMIQRSFEVFWSSKALWPLVQPFLHQQQLVVMQKFLQTPPKYRKIESDAKEYRSFVGQALFAKNEKGESIVEKFARTFKNMNHFQFYYIGSNTFESNIDYCTIISKSSRENGLANFDLCTFHFIF